MAIDNCGVLCVSQETCILCGGPGALIHEGLSDRLFGAPGTWSTRRCRNARCGLAWLDPQPLPGEIGKLYRDYYTHGTEQEIATLDAGEQEAPPDVGAYVSKGPKKRIKELLGRAMFWRRAWLDSDLMHLGSRPPGRLLDVGCGAGQYMKLVQAAGWDPVGIDFDEKAVAMARRRGLDARVGDLREAAFPNSSFDAITMINVIEHLQEPAAVVAECRRILKPGGRLIMATPNIDASGHRIYGPDWRGLEIPRHLFLYSARTLKRIAVAAGFGRAEAFSQLRNAPGALFMVNESRLIAERSGRAAPEVDPAVMNRRASLLGWLGVSRGEFVFLVAEK